MGFNEADTRAKLIDPNLHQRGWSEDYISREKTPGGIDVVNGKPRRRSRGRMDYVLRFPMDEGQAPIPIALIEAKAEDYAPAHGLDQAKGYANCTRHNIQFVFSTNGHLFVEFDRSTKLISSPKPLSEFPLPETLKARYQAKQGFELSSEAAKPLITMSKMEGITLRYYQDAAIRASLEKIARCKAKDEPSRVLLSLATGAGKTFIAVALMKRIADAGQLRKVLFVCDRDELRTQASKDFLIAFGNDAAVVSAKKPQKNAKILIATYQTLGFDGEDGDGSFLSTHYPPDYFSHIVIDECHRSAWGKWSQVLTQNSKAIQIGLTATPRELDIPDDHPEAKKDKQITADNLRYFGEPVYEYSIGQGMEDGYLSACQIQRTRVNLDDTGITKADILARNPTDAKTGRPISESELNDLYEQTSYEDRVMLPDRVVAMCADFFDYLLETGGPEQKTVIFCVRDYHAAEVAIEMQNLYARWCNEQGLQACQNYAFRCTSASGGKDFLPDLKGSKRDYFVATTVDLLTTGVNVPALRNVLFFRYMNSPISFYQMVGRGTRIDEETEKLMFHLYDYTNATRLFGQSFLSKLTGSKDKTDRDSDDSHFDDDSDRPPIIQVEGFDVELRSEGQFILTVVNGQETPITVDEYQKMLAERLLSEVPTVEGFLERWVLREERLDLLNQLHSGSLSSSVVQQLREMEGYDLYDVLLDLGYQLPPLTRPMRVQSFFEKEVDWLEKMPEPASNMIRAVVSQFEMSGTDGLESKELFRVPSVIKTGGVRSLKLLGKPGEVILEMKRKLFAA